MRDSLLGGLTPQCPRIAMEWMPSEMRDDEETTDTEEGEDDESDD